MFIPPPLLKIIFFPLSRHVIFRLPLWPFCLNSSLFCICYTLSLPLSHFLPPFFLFCPFFLFLLHFPPFSLPFHIFSPKWHRLISPPPGELQLSWNNQFRLCNTGPSATTALLPISDICVNATYCPTGDIAFILNVAELHKFPYLFEMFLGSIKKSAAPAYSRLRTKSRCSTQKHRCPRMVIGSK
jgi:energy-coupling factor transporter transmembrane protein EcfT